MPGRLDWRKLERQLEHARKYGQIARPQWVPVRSSNVRAVRWNAADHTFDIRYREGRTYRYFDIEPGEAQELMRRSHGEHVWDILRVRGSRTAHRKLWKEITGTAAAA